MCKKGKLKVNAVYNVQYRQTEMNVFVMCKTDKQKMNAVSNVQNR